MLDEWYSNCRNAACQLLSEVSFHLFVSRELRQYPRHCEPSPWSYPPVRAPPSCCRLRTDHWSTHPGASLATPICLRGWGLLGPWPHCSAHTAHTAHTVLRPWGCHYCFPGMPTDVPYCTPLENRCWDTQLENAWSLSKGTGLSL